MANVFAMLAARYPAPAWAYFTEVHSTLGTSANQRRADALAFGLWQSRGFELHGHEVKHNRADVLRELADPSKADAFQRFCDRWWLVVSDPALIKRDEIPATWGVLAPSKGALRAIKPAPELTPQPWSRGFIAAMLRQGSASSIPRATYDALQAELQARAREQGERIAKEMVDKEARRITQRLAAAEEELTRIRAALATFERASGISVETFAGWRSGLQAAAIGRLAGHLATEGRDLGRIATALEQAAKLAREAAIETTPATATDAAYSLRSGT